MPVTVNINSTDRGEIYTTRDDERTISVLVSTSELNAFGTRGWDMNNGLKTFTIPIGQNSTQYLGSKFIETAQSDFTRFLLAPARNYYSATLQLKKTTQARLDEYAAVNSNDSFVEAVVRSEIRTLFQKSKPGDQTRMIQDADYRTLCAICEAPAVLTGMPAELHKMAVERMIFANIVKKLGLNADSAKKATLSEPLAYGIDAVAAETLAKEVLANLESKLEACELASLTIRRTCDFVALITQREPEEILNEIASA